MGFYYTMLEHQTLDQAGNASLANFAFSSFKGDKGKKFLSIANNRQCYKTFFSDEYSKQDVLGPSQTFQPGL